jgi:hypothetical protein
VPLCYAPLLRRLARREWKGRRLALPLLSAIIVLPLAAWPSLVLGGALSDLTAGNPGTAFAMIVRSLDVRRSWPLYALYGLFGAVMGIWYSTSVRGGRSGERRHD